MVVATPPRAIGPLTYLAFRAAAYDPPEDFIARIESGIDTETRSRLERGVRALRLLRKMERWVFAFLGIGVVVLIAGSGLATAVGVAGLVSFVLLSAFTVWALAGAAFSALTIVSLRHHTDLRTVYAFWRATRGSSLARDLA